MDRSFLRCASTEAERLDALSECEEDRRPFIRQNESTAARTFADFDAILLLLGNRVRYGVLPVVVHLLIVWSQ